MSSTLHVAGIAGSLRQGSHSRAVLAAIRQMLPAGARFTEIDPGALPHYDVDLDTAAPPEPVATARGIVADADLLLLAVPEYNHGIPGVLKNTLDWLSRPAFRSCAIGRTVIFVTLSEGALGGVRAQYQLRETLSSMLCVLPPMREIAITGVQHKLDGTRITDAATHDLIAATLAGVLAGLAPGAARAA